MTIGARIEPTEVEALNRPCASARSLVGNHSALDLVVPGHGPASPRPSMKRNAVSDLNPAAKAVKASAAPHSSAEKAKPRRVPMRS